MGAAIVKRVMNFGQAATDPNPPALSLLAGKGSQAAALVWKSLPACGEGFRVGQSQRFIRACTKSPRP
jgi:hypothetical protein